ncbi:MAG TPA: cation:proton antiporter [Acidimicrobiales bacterium]|nr:cation:proton antiporter [Acidimicrobiales bacterium]
MDPLHLNEPSGDAFVFLVLFAVVVGGPLVVEKLKIPGIIGLFLGGLLIGPHGLGFIGSGNTTVFSLGKLGLLYLMFVAGLELDLGLVKRHRRSVVVFSVLSFAMPMAAGTVAGLLLDFGTGAAILLGALLASHTLIVYPTVKSFRLGSDPAVATGVGATVVTDTLALIILAVIVGSTEVGASSVEIAIQTGLGLLIVAGFSFLLLPRVATLFMARFGSSRTNRYVFALVALLSAATVAQVVDIEGIIGAFFAGLALNRLVPNEGDLMHRIDFFGAAVFIPVFIVSVGLVLDPGVMAEPETLRMAGIFVLACVGGKAIAAALTRPFLGFSWSQVGVLFSLTAAQAAATLAVADVGKQHGLFGNAVFNAVLGLILVSLIVASVVASFSGQRVPVPPKSPTPTYGDRVLLIGTEDCLFRAGVAALAMRLASTDAGVVLPVIVAPDGDSMPGFHEIEKVERRLTSVGVDLPVTVHVDGDSPAAVQHAITSLDASAAVIDDPSGEWLNVVQTGDVPYRVPLLIVGAVAGRCRRVVVRPDPLAVSVPVGEIARRLAPARTTVVIDDSGAGGSAVETGTTDLVVSAVGADVQPNGAASTVVTIV